jgi:hypothetical protein
MRVTLNLSKRPFTNHRLFWIGVVSLLFVAFWLGLWMLDESSRVAAESDRVRNLIKAQEGEVLRLKEEQEKRAQAEQQVYLSEIDSLQLASARRLIAAKAFSWNRLIGHVERYVPKDARVTGIQVTGASSENGSVIAQIEIKAVGKSAAQLTEMMSSLEGSSGLFQVRRFTQDAATDAGEIPFALVLTYQPDRGGADE